MPLLNNHGGQHIIIIFLIATYLCVGFIPHIARVRNIGFDPQMDMLLFLFLFPFFQILLNLIIDKLLIRRAYLKYYAFGILFLFVIPALIEVVFIGIDHGFNITFLLYKILLFFTALFYWHMAEKYPKWRAWERATIVAGLWLVLHALLFGLWYIGLILTN